MTNSRASEAVNIDKYFRLFMGCSKDVFWIRNPDYSKQLYISPSYEEVWGRSCESLYKHPECWIDTLLPEDVLRLQASIAERNPNTNPDQRFFQSYRIIKPNGEIRWIEDESFAIYDKHKVHIGFAGICSDVTEKKQKEAELQKAKEKAESANIAKSQFIANISHDIRTPLIGIQGIADWLIPQVDKALKADISSIKTASHSLLNLLNDVINLIELDSGQIESHTTSFDLKTLIDDIQSTFEALLRQKNLYFKIEYDFDCPKLFLANVTLIKRVLINLISNAIKFTSHGGITVTIKQDPQNGITKNKTEFPVEIAINDTGIGIEKKHQQTIFERFSRLSPAYEGKFQGSGLGLHISKEFLKEINGKISVKSQPGEGSTFYVHLLLQQSTQQLMTQTQQSATHPLTKPEYHQEEEQNKVKTNLNESNVQVLLVEDNKMIQKVTTHLLNEHDCTVTIAQNGKEALSLANKRRYNFILMDIGLPDISGIEVTETIKASLDNPNNNTPIIALTAHNDLHKKTDIMDLILKKPFTGQLCKDLLARYPTDKTATLYPQIQKS